VLSRGDLALLADALVVDTFKRREIILREEALASESHILLKGVAVITCLNARNQRITVAMLAPGPIPEFPLLPSSRWDFQCEAYAGCRVAMLGWEQFPFISAVVSQAVLRHLHQDNLKQWYRLLLRGSGLLSLNLQERISMALLELCSDFGIEEARGTLLGVNISHKDLANMAGATRPRVTEHLAQLEREHLLIRQGRQMVICVPGLEQSVGVHVA